MGRRPSGRRRPTDPLFTDPPGRVNDYRSTGGVPATSQFGKSRTWQSGASRAASPRRRSTSLYHGPLEEFTSARNELAKSLRADGDAKGADQVKALAKPSRAAWLVNQLSVRKPDEVAELLELGSELRAAQEEMLAGSTDREKLREVARREQKAVDSLLRTAEAIGREHGVGEQILTRVGETLQAAAGDPDVAEAIRRGRLTPRAARGVDRAGRSGDARRTATRKKGKDREAAERRARQEQAKRRKEAERKLPAAEKRLTRERAKLERARESVEEAERSVHAAELDAHAARRELDEI